MRLHPLKHKFKKPYQAITQKDVSIHMIHASLHHSEGSIRPETPFWITPHIFFNKMILPHEILSLILKFKSDMAVKDKLAWWTKRRNKLSGMMRMKRTAYLGFRNNRAPPRNFVQVVSNDGKCKLYLAPEGKPISPSTFKNPVIEFYY